MKTTFGVMNNQRKNSWLFAYFWQRFADLKSNCPKPADENLSAKRSPLSDSWNIFWNAFLIDIFKSLKLWNQSI